MQPTNPRIILHSPEPVSSPAIYVHELVRALTEIGTPVHVVAPANHQARQNFERNPLVTFHPSAARSLGKHGLLMKIGTNLRFLLSSCFVLLRTARRGDIVHFQYVLHFPFGALFFLGALMRGCTIVFTVHDPLPHKWLLPRTFRGIEKGALGWSYKTSHLLFVHSESGKRTLAQHFPEVTNKVHVIAHGAYQLDVALLPRPSSKYLDVLLFGALRENKGARLAIEAVQQLYREQVPVRLTIAGGVSNRKEQGYWDECRKLIANCPEPIRLMEGFVPDDHVPELLGNCHCLLLPYTNFFSDSGVAFLALSNGRAILSTKSGGLQALLESSGGGLPIEEPSTAAVAAALREAVTLGPEHLDRLGRAGRRWVLEEGNWHKIADQTRKLYQQLVKTLHKEDCDECRKQPIFN